MLALNTPFTCIMKFSQADLMCWGAYLIEGGVGCLISGRGDSSFTRSPIREPTFGGFIFSEGGLNRKEEQSSYQPELAMSHLEQHSNLAVPGLGYCYGNFY